MDEIPTEFLILKEKILSLIKKFCSFCLLKLQNFFHYSAEIAPKPQEFKQVPQSTQALASIA